jgi:hypothetical protein
VNTLVIDASIAVKWVVEENGTAEALVLRQKAKFETYLIFRPCFQRTIHSRVHSKRLDKLSSTPGRARPGFFAKRTYGAMRMNSRLARLCRWRNVLGLIG